MKRVVTFGEAIIRLSPPGYGRIEQARSVDVYVGGAELNAAAGLARLGVGSAFVTAIPDTPAGRLVLSQIMGAGVDVRHIVLQSDGKIGICFAELGASPDSSRIVYDWDGSTVNRLRGFEFDWKKIFTDFDHFHVSGSTPALGTGCLDLTKGALTAAKKMGLSTSFDINYRSHLWTEVRAQETITSLMDKVDHLIASEQDIKRVLKIREKDHEALSRELVERFGLESCAVTIRDNVSMREDRWTGIASNGRSYFTDRVYDVEVVDRFGSDDAFCAGYIYGIITGDYGTGLKIGNAMAALKHSMPGDMIVCTKEEVMALARSGDASKRAGR